MSPPAELSTPLPQPGDGMLHVSLNRRHTVGAGLLLVAATTDALALVAMGLLAGSVDALLLALFVNVGVGVGVSALLFVGWRRAVPWEFFGQRSFWAGLVRSRLFGLSVLARLDAACFVLAAAQIGAARASVILGTAPILYMFLLARLVPAVDGTHRYQSFSLRGAAAVFVAFVGCGFTTLSQPGVFVDGSVVAGVLLGFLAALFSALNACNVVWGVGLAKQFPVGDYDRVRGCRVGDAGAGFGDATETACVMFVAFVAAAVSVPVLVLFVAVTGGFAGLSVPAVAFLGAFLVGAVLWAAGVVLYRVANLRTSCLSVNAVGYLTPALAVGLLAVIGRLGDVRPVLLLVGVVLVVSANLLLCVPALSCFGFRARRRRDPAS